MQHGLLDGQRRGEGTRRVEELVFGRRQLHVIRQIVERSGPATGPGNGAERTAGTGAEQAPEWVVSVTIG